MSDHGSGDDEATRMAPRRPAAGRPNPPAMEMREISALAAANPLLAAANPLLMMLQTLRVASAPGSVFELRTKLIDMVKDFDAVCVKARIEDVERNLSNYALCAVVDEFVQMTPWGSAANWAQHNLLIQFHGESSGGERFFDILNHIAASPAVHQRALELYYVCLALGFMGRFQLEGPVGRQTVTDLREKVFQLVRQGRPEPDRSLASQWHGVEVEARRFRGFLTAGAAVAVMAMLCLAVFAFFYWSLGATFDALQLDNLSIKRAPRTPLADAPAAKPRLVQLLGPQIAANQVQVVDRQLESVVTLLGENVFDSGSAEPSAAAGELIDKIADALRQVDGNVIVLGHTDNVPTRTLRFASNFALSKERAASVAQRLLVRLGDVRRVSSDGRGDSEPAASNDTPQGRARNRRVEIVLKVADASH